MQQPRAITLNGTHVRLEPLGPQHVPGLVAAAAEDRALYEWSAVPQGHEAMSRYVATAAAWHADGTALAFATVRAADGRVLGSSRFFLIELWEWPAGPGEARREGFDGCEIVYTWLAASAIRTGANTEAKRLMLSHAFDAWGVHRVCFHTDARNARSRAALERIGAQFEGILRAHRLSTDLQPRDSARFSILRSEWPRVKARLTALEAALSRPGGATA